MKATFFVTGHDFDKPIDDPTAPYATIMKRTLDEGHQIAHHTWTHENLTAINNTRITNQMIYNEMAIRNVLGFIPTYMRPPYLQCTESCLKIMGDLGYHVVRANLDTKGMYRLAVATSFGSNRLFRLRKQCPGTDSNFQKRICQLDEGKPVRH